MLMFIRQENNNDYEEVYQLIKCAFKSAEYSDGNEQDLVSKLRKGKAFIPELSLVALSEEKIVGHIMFTKAYVDNIEILVLAPISVFPEFQNKGIGTALIKEGHKIASELGYGYSVVLGSEKYYPKFGYVVSSLLGIYPPKELPAKNFMAIKLLENAAPLNGYVKFAEEFGL